MFWYENGKRQSHKNCGSEQEQMGFLSYRSGALSSTTALKATKNAHPQNRDFVNRHAAKKHAQVPRTHMTNEIGMMTGTVGKTSNFCFSMFLSGTQQNGAWNDLLIGTAVLSGSNHGAGVNNPSYRTCRTSEGHDLDISF